jgi:hypothetical protein
MKITETFFIGSSFSTTNAKIIKAIYSSFSNAAAILPWNTAATSIPCSSVPGVYPRVFAGSCSIKEMWENLPLLTTTV